MRTINEIIERQSRRNIFPTEEESAEIKQIVKEIISYFPLEYSEVIDELDNKL